jgi:hypothetical protein
MPQGWPDSTDRLMGADLYEAVSAASNNAATIKASPGVVVAYFVGNIAASFRYVKLYNKASNPSPGSDTPVFVIAVPPTLGANIAFPYPLGFSTGIAIAIVTGISNTDNTSTGASEVVCSIAYI